MTTTIQWRLHASRDNEKAMTSVVPVFDLAD